MHSVSSEATRYIIVIALRENIKFGNKNYSSNYRRIAMVLFLAFHQPNKQRSSIGFAELPRSTFCLYKKVWK